MNPKKKWWIDIFLFSGFLVAFFLDLTGLALHQWLWLSIALLAGYHLLIHWSWVAAVTKRLLDANPNKSKLFYLVDGIISTCMVGIIATGLVISSWFNLSLANYDTWLQAHILVSAVTLTVIVIKIGLHWRWIVNITRFIFLRSPVSQQHPTPKTRPYAVSASGDQISRKEFLQFMGTVSFVSAVALLTGLKGLENSTSDLTSESAGETDSSPVWQSANDPSMSNSLQACSIQCGRRCSFPGHCRRNVDRDGNNRCDYGECA